MKWKPRGKRLVHLKKMNLELEIAQQQQQPIAPIVNWERYLPFRSLKVLLVENDDSTRHIVTALLNKCSFEVIAVSNVREAWRILEDEKSCIDLVLTEVVIPEHPGTGLLCKIVSHKTLNHFPVIMMSSHDSMTLVFKCLSKGAVDFLAKPIRKNELKNLWQHVWRRFQSTSGSGSESGIQNKKALKTGNIEGSGNNDSISGEHHLNENGSNGSSNEDENGSDNGSGTQSSWTKRGSDTNKSKEAEDQNEQIGTGTQARMCVSGEAGEPGNLEKDDEKYDVQALERNDYEMLNRSCGDSQVDQSVLRHSIHSAFSKYNNTASCANKAPQETVGSCSPQDSSVGKIMGSDSRSDKPLNQKSSGRERAAQREAALMKFRLKLKERCFEKKVLSKTSLSYFYLLRKLSPFCCFCFRVRYHSRKKLAEQRPRVKGQFNKNAEAHREYEAEIKALQAANHPNVIKILGKCIDQRRIVVYEFMPKGSLDHYLYAQTRPDRFGGLLQEYPVLNWETRMKIAVGVAHALVYLHEGLGLIHRDIKIANGLLDENFVPKLTDFGLATKVVRDRHGAERQIEIDPIKGTPGCAAPETLDYGMVSN